MPDIFISYSRKDEHAAGILCERLKRAGHDVWIDQQDLSAATQWSEEIARAIEEASVFIILLSKDSITSHNVLKELSLASEKQRHIIPIAVDEVSLPHSFQYPLAGLQRVSIKELDQIESAVSRFLSAGLPPRREVTAAVKPGGGRSSIWRISALALFGIALAVAYLMMHKPSRPQAHPVYTTRKVAVMPFENLGGSTDEHLADGITSDVINRLANLYCVKVTDRKTVMTYKGKKTDIKTIAGELGVDYVVDGTLERDGDKIHVASQLTEAGTGKIVLSDQFDGNASDVLMLERRMGQAIAFELQYALRQIPETILVLTPSNDPVANVLVDSGSNRTDRAVTRAEFDRALATYDSALKIDPTFVSALLGKVGLIEARFRRLDRDTSRLHLADSLISLSERNIRDQNLAADGVYIRIWTARLAECRGDTDKQERILRELVELAPDDPDCVDLLWNYYAAHGRFSDGARWTRQQTERDIINLEAWNMLIVCYDFMHDSTMQRRTIDEFLPIMQRWLAKHELDYSHRILESYYLAELHRNDEALAELTRARRLESKWASQPYLNAACVYSILGDVQRANELLEHCLALDSNRIESIRTDPDLGLVRAQRNYERLLLDGGARIRAARH